LGSISRLLTGGLKMTIDEARDYLVEHNNAKYQNYIRTQLAGDFAVEIALEHNRLAVMLEIMFDKEEAFRSK
jgi:hypothetical protein